VSTVTLQLVKPRQEAVDGLNSLHVSIIEWKRVKQPYKKVLEKETAVNSLRILQCIVDATRGIRYMMMAWQKVRSGVDSFSEVVAMRS
jgi:hypothetical protein